ncbi:hypothetical protein EDD16DRAFT_1522540 [Pisolithus croceorrhizus]|nr:hypothetical protein EV401DRAFT_1895538 [Pisolithus croceorrhizus]KAI6109308.1 hypothetical protein EDD16DRAFT_1522540 [Pisolithus croceorrhizus]KAI6167767.1 hypothetical protein EDD17DRAFT_1503983 [Pisolithus thermaeus]
MSNNSYVLRSPGLDQKARLLMHLTVPQQLNQFSLDASVHSCFIMASSQAALALHTMECCNKNLSPCSVLEAQQEKAHLCAAWNWERKKVKLLARVNVCSNRDIDYIPDQCSVDSHMESTSFLHSSMASPTPTLPDLWLSINAWKSDWGPESVWLKKFDESLCKACIFDLLEAVLVEVKFFEVKLDEYAPAVPYSKVSNARYYSRM